MYRQQGSQSRLSTQRFLRVNFGQNYGCQWQQGPPGRDGKYQRSPPMVYEQTNGDPILVNQTYLFGYYPSVPADPNFYEVPRSRNQGARVTVKGNRGRPATQPFNRKTNYNHRVNPHINNNGRSESRSRVMLPDSDQVPLWTDKSVREVVKPVGHVDGCLCMSCKRYNSSVIRELASPKESSDEVGVHRGC